MKSLLLLSLLTLSLMTQAKVHSLASVTSSESSDYSWLFLETDDQTGEALSLITQEFNKKQKKIDEQEFSRKEINQEGAVLSEEEGLEVVIVQNLRFKDNKGGSVELNYLKSGISKKRGNLKIGVRPNKKGWELYNLKNGRTFKSMHFKAKKVFGKAIGIKEIQLR